VKKIIAFTKVDLPYGWLGNMSPHPVTHDGKTYRTAEALFQALRFDDEAIREAVRNEKSPMAAKMRAKKHRDKFIVAPQSTIDVENMRAVLHRKLACHPTLTNLLAATGDAFIVEDCSRRPRGSGLFWGAALVDGQWQGANTLGRLWMEIRDKGHP
jgi:ribA/ribD-fused uncharacterized protein